MVNVRKRVLNAILPFSGTEAEKFVGFLGAIDGGFEILNIEESEKAPLLLSCLRGYLEEPCVELSLRKKIKCLKQTGTVSEAAFKFQQLAVRITAMEIECISLFVYTLSSNIRACMYKDTN